MKTNAFSPNLFWVFWITTAQLVMVLVSVSAAAEDLARTTIQPDGMIVIENAFVRRVLSAKKDEHLQTKSIVNKRISVSIEPTACNEF